MEVIVIKSRIIKIIYIFAAVVAVILITLIGLSALNMNDAVMNTDIENTDQNSDNNQGMGSKTLEEVSLKSGFFHSFPLAVVDDAFIHNADSSEFSNHVEFVTKMSEEEAVTYYKELLEDSDEFNFVDEDDDSIVCMNEEHCDFISVKAEESDIKRGYKTNITIDFGIAYCEPTIDEEIVEGINPGFYGYINYEYAFFGFSIDKNNNVNHIRWKLGTDISEATVEELNVTEINESLITYMDEQKENQPLYIKCTSNKIRVDMIRYGSISRSYYNRVEAESMEDLVGLFEQAKEKAQAEIVGLWMREDSSPGLFRGTEFDANGGGRWITLGEDGKLDETHFAYLITNPYVITIVDGHGHKDYKMHCDDDYMWIEDRTVTSSSDIMTTIGCHRIETYDNYFSEDGTSPMAPLTEANNKPENSVCLYEYIDYFSDEILEDIDEIPVLNKDEDFVAAEMPNEERGMYTTKDIWIDSIEFSDKLGDYYLSDGYTFVVVNLGYENTSYSTYTLPNFRFHGDVYIDGCEDSLLYLSPEEDNRLGPDLKTLDDTYYPKDSRWIYSLAIPLHDSIIKSGTMWLYVDENNVIGYKFKIK